MQVHSMSLTRGSMVQLGDCLHLFFDKNINLDIVQKMSRLWNEACQGNSENAMDRSYYVPCQEIICLVEYTNAERITL